MQFDRLADPKRNMTALLKGKGILLSRNKVATYKSPTFGWLGERKPAEIADGMMEVRELDETSLRAAMKVSTFRLA